MTTHKNLDNYSLIHYGTLAAIIVAALVMGMVVSLMIGLGADATLRLNAAQCAVARDDLQRTNAELRGEVEALTRLVRAQQAAINQLETEQALDDTFENLDSAHRTYHQGSTGALGFSMRSR